MVVTFKMTIRKIILVTSNEMKRREFEQIAKKFLPNVEVEKLDLDIDEVQSTSVTTVAMDKINKVKGDIESGSDLDPNVPIVVDDTGLSIQQMNGFPGALVKFYIRHMGAGGIVERNSDSEARCMTCLGVLYRGQTVTYHGETAGHVVSRSNFNTDHNDEGYNWDVLFVPTINTCSPYYGNTFYDMPAEIKNEISPRYRAIEAMMNDIIAKSRQV